MSKNKGMSRGGRLLALLAVLAVLCGGYFVVTNMTQKEAVIETGGSFEVAGLTPDEITSMAWQNGDETIRLVRADGVWSLDGEANFPLKQDVADELASDIAALEATHTVTGGADAADYGLDEPAFTVTVENDSGDTLVYQMGAKNDVTGEYYLRFSENDAIYTIASSLAATFDYNRASLLDAPVIPSLDGATRLVIAGTDADVDQADYADSTGMTYTDAYHWFNVTADNVVKPSDADSVQALLTKISGIALTDCCDYNATEQALEGYGLSPARLTVEVEYVPDGAESETEYERFALYIGAQDEETGLYYAALPDSPLVFRVSADTAEALLSARNDDVRADDVLLMNWDGVTGIEFALDGATHTLLREEKAVEPLEGAIEMTETEGVAESAEDETAEAAATEAAAAEATADAADETAAAEPQQVWLLDGVEVSEDAVAQLEKSLDALTSAGVAEPSEGGAEVLRMAILRDGESFDRVELSFSAYDAQNYLYELMGEKRLLVSADKVDAIVRQLRYLGAE